MVEIRPVFEADDFGEEFTPELREQEERLRSQIGGAEPSAHAGAEAGRARCQPRRSKRSGGSSPPG